MRRWPRRRRRPRRGRPLPGDRGMELDRRITATVPPSVVESAATRATVRTNSSTRPGAPRVGARAAHRPPARPRARRRGQQPVGDVHDLRGCAVVDREQDAVRRHPHRQVGDDVVPAGERAGPARLTEVAHQRHRTRWAATGEHAPLHRGEVLRLVDEHVAERAQLTVVVAGCGRRRAVAGEMSAALVNAPTPSSSTVRCAYARSDSRRARRRVRGRAALGAPRMGIGLVDQREVGVGPLHRGEVGGHARGTRSACSSSVRSPPAAERTRAAKPKKSRTSSVPLRTGHVRSSAARTSGSRRTVCVLSSHSGGAASPRASPAATVGSDTVAAERSAVS